jgi:hypothetical protein
MANHRHLPDPPYTPPTDVEMEHGYYLDCPGCGRQWSQRFVDRHLNRCLPCARAWRREDQASRRKGLGGVPLTTTPPPHPFESRVLHREVDLNDMATHKLLETNLRFRDEVTAYIEKLVAQNGRPKTPLYGVLSRLSAPKTRLKANRVELDEDEPEQAPLGAAEAVNAAVDAVMGAIDGEIVDEKRKPRRRS